MSVPLPPLPPAIGAEPARPAGPSAREVLSGEHGRILHLVGRLADPQTRAGHRRRLAQVVTATLVRHLSAEEQYLYPAVRAVLPDGDRLADRELAEDRALLLTLRELEDTAPADPEYGRLTGAVLVQVRRHVTAGDAELLPGLAAAAPAADLVRLGNRLETAEEAAPTRPHPSAPDTPPWNKVVDPSLGLLDKVRDAVSGRVTYLEDL